MKITIILVYNHQTTELNQEIKKRRATINVTITKPRNN